MDKPNFMSVFRKTGDVCKRLVPFAEPKPEDFKAPGTSFAVDEAMDRFFAFFDVFAKTPAFLKKKTRRFARRADRRLILARIRAERAIAAAYRATAERAFAFVGARILPFAARAASAVAGAATRVLKPVALAARAAALRSSAVVRRALSGAARKSLALLAAGAESMFARFSRAVERENKIALLLLRFIKSVWILDKSARTRAYAVCVRLAARFAAADAAVTAVSDRAWAMAARSAVCGAEGALAFARALRRAWRWICIFSDVHKKAVLTASALFLVLSVCAVSAVNAQSAYAYMYNGKTLGIVNDKKTVYSAVRLVGDKLSRAYNAEINIDEDRDISFKRVFGASGPVDSPDDVLNNLTYMKDMKVKGYTIVADDKAIATFDSETTARGFLKEVQNRFLNGANAADYKEVGFAENVRIDEIDTKLAYLTKPADVFDYVMTGAIEQRYHSVEKGQTLSGIAGIYGLGLSELMAMNPDVVPERLQIGQQLKLERVVPLLTVQTTEVATYIEEIPFEITYENSSAMFKGEQTVRLTGAKGERQVTAEIVKENGVETGKNELASVTLTSPTAQVVLVGTKDPPPLMGTGAFQYPTRGKLTSRFGMRWGRMHKGIDLAASTGTSIRAADGGKVTFAGWSGSLGYLVKIDHGGNRETWYGHCSKLLVRAGDRVYQGQHIANVGNTGNSTGSHLHFEVHINGTPKNPLNYL
jgi:murein DD-endopeptidase MepM/ murein hydrolase activator NlpD